MFISLSYTTHTIISISLHVLGVVVGLFVWYLFPKHVSYKQKWKKHSVLSSEKWQRGLAQAISHDDSNLFQIFRAHIINSKSYFKEKKNNFGETLIQEPCLISKKLESRFSADALDRPTPIGTSSCFN